MKEIKVLLLIISIILILCFQSCESGAEVPTIADNIQISEVYWNYKNLSKEYQNLVWGFQTDSTCFFSFSLEYTGIELNVDDIKSLKATHSGVTLEVPIEKDILFKFDDSLYGISGYYSYQNETGQGDFFSLGPWEYTFVFADSSTKNVIKTFNKPGSTVIEENSFVATEDCNLIWTNDNFYLMIKRADIFFSELDVPDNKLNIQFDIDDAQARTGYICFYNSDGNYLGASAVFVDSNGNLSSELTSGFNTNGNQNTVVVDFDNYTDINPTEITYVVIKLVDGKQYEGTAPGFWDCCSYSNVNTVSKVY